MAEDLYRLDLQRTPAAQLFAAVEGFTSIKSPPDQRPREGYLLDFKQDWSDSALHTVAGFANTFGGLLILGVSDNKDGVPEDIVGIPSVGELKTRIGSLISTNLLPCPSFEIGECALPTDPAKKVCVVRVKESAEMCLVTKKGERPVRVRVEDQSPPADAVQLRDLIRRKESRQRFPSRLDSLRSGWGQSLLVTRIPQTGSSQRVMSSTRSWAVLFPFEHPEIEIDVNIEKAFDSIIGEYFSFFGREDERIDLGPRARDSFQIHRLIIKDDFERVWQFDSSGAFGLASQMAWNIANRNSWSLCDLAIDLSSLLRASRKFWESFGYFGGARLVVRLNIQELNLYREGQGFPALVYGSSPPIARNAVALSPTPVTTTPLEFELEVTFQTDVVYAVSRIINQLMRSLGHATDLPKLEQSLRVILPPEPD
jgi:hypothetical protein